jgi:hypothetical protein
MVNGNELYDLSDDPAEQENRVADQPEIFEELKTAYESWWKQIISQSYLKLKPVVVGHAESPLTYLQPHHGQVKGDLKFEGKRGLIGENLGFHPSGVDGDWVVNWKEEGDQIIWDIYVVETGAFEIGFVGSGWDSIKLDRLSLVLDNDLIEITAHLNDHQGPDHTNILNTMTLPEGIHQIGLQVKQSIPDIDTKLFSLSLSMQN